MMRIYKLSFALLVTFLTAAVALAAQAPIVTSKVSLSTNKLTAGGKFNLTVTAVVKPGYHIGANDKDALYPAKLTLEAPKGITFEKPVYPKAKRIALGMAPGEKLPVYEGKIVIRVKGKVAKNVKPGPITITSKLNTQACKGEACYPPETSTVRVKATVVNPDVKAKAANVEVFGSTGASNGAGGDLNGLAAKLAGMPAWLQVLMLYGLGLVLAFTPCVYPMVPVTVGYFSNQSGERTRKVLVLAAAYVLGIAFTYAILGVTAAVMGDRFDFSAAIKEPTVVIGIAAVLVLLALSMFGLFELRAPSFIQSRSAARNGIAGALIMGLIFGIVATPCAGPVVLAVTTYVALLGSPLMGFLLFFMLALGIGTPLFVLATTSAKLPLPGMWMVAVKKVAGFLLLGVAAYFLVSVVPEPVARYLLPAVILAGGVYLGFVEKSIKSSKIASSVGKAGGMAALAAAVMMSMPSESHNALKWETYTPAKVEQAANAGMPVMIDFTAKWCTYCRKLEQGPFRDAEVMGTARGFKMLRVDGTRRSNAVIAAEEKYNVRGFYPTIIFLDESGKEIKSARVVGYADSKELIRRIESVR